jgi:hypothetical protein
MIKMSQFKKYYLYSLIGSLIASAVVAVVTILVGSFTDITGRVLGTLALVVAHSILSLAIVNDENNKINKLTFFSDTLFVLIVSSLMVSLFAVWELISPELTSKLYVIFFAVGFSALHSNTIYLIKNKEKLISRLVKINQYVIGTTLLIALPAILIENMDDMYYRLFGSIAVVDVTLTVISVILYKLYLQKHPNEKNELQYEHKNGGVLRVLLTIFFAYILLQMLFSLLFFSLSTFSD